MEKNKKTPLKVTSSTVNGIKQATILLTGNLSLEEMPNVKLLMIQNFDKYSLFHVVLQDVENIDLGMVQLLYSFRWTVERKSKEVSFTFSLPDEYRILIEHGGFKDLINITK